MKDEKILMVVTSADKLDQMHSTGVWLEEFAVPYQAFVENGYEVTVASPLGGTAPIDKASIPNFSKDEWNFACKVLDQTEELDEVDYRLYSALIMPGGHGPMIDLVKNRALGQVIEYFDYYNLLIGAICHGPAGLLSAKKEDGSSFVCGRKLTAFTNEEEKAAKKDKLVPFMLEDRLKLFGAEFVKEKPGAEFVVIDDNLVTGQNFQSSKLFAETILRLMN